MDISELIEQVKRGNREALVQLIMAEKTSYYKLAYVYTQNKEDAMVKRYLFKNQEGLQI